MTKNKIIVLREGINSTFQDLGRNNFYHIGLPFSGAMDKRNYLIANKLVGNQHNEAVIEFADAMKIALAFPSLLGAYFLCNKVATDLENYMKRLQTGEIISEN